MARSRLYECRSQVKFLQQQSPMRTAVFGSFLRSRVSKTNYYRLASVSATKTSNGIRHMQHNMKDTTKAASDILIEHWQKGTTLAHLPEDVRPKDPAEGYEIQRHVERLTSKLINPTDYSPLLSSRIVLSRPCVNFL